MHSFLGFNRGVTSFKKILKDGSVTVLRTNGNVRSIAEERIKQSKAYGGYESSLPAVLKEEGIFLSDVKKITESSCCEMFDNPGTGLLKYLNKEYETQVIPHHYSHALSTYALSGFKEAIVIVWDCGGNYFENVAGNKWWLSKREQHSYYLAKGWTIEKVDEDFERPGEMGFGEVYRSLTHLLGFGSYIHSSKAMSISTLGNSKRWKDKSLFSFHEGRLFSPFKYKEGDNYQYLIDWAKANLNIELKKVTSDRNLEDKNMLDFAALVQRSMEDAAIQKVNHLIRKHNVKNVCIAGGVGLNCILNTKIRRNTSLQNLFIPPASGDTGQSMGNAIFGYWVDKGKFPKVSEFTYIGSTTRVRKLTKSDQRDLYCIKLRNYEKEKLAAVLIEKGHIIGWCQGNSEWGPRALGNRSILCRADNVAIEEKLREEIKFRKWYEPFAASILREDLKEYFDSDIDLPFMLEVVYALPPKRSSLVSCLNKNDNSCRIQTVSKASNSTLHRLLKYYKKISGESVLLNTSLNQRGYPIAETAKDAMMFFKTSKLDIIFIDNHLFLKSNSSYEAVREILNSLNKHLVLSKG